MNLEELQNEWREDCKIEKDHEKLAEASRGVPSLHAKYLEYYNNFSLMKKEREMKYKTLLREKTEFYLGKAPAKVYAENPFDLKILKQDLPLYLESDVEIQQAVLKLEYLDTIINTCDSILRMINGRSYQIKNVIECEKYFGIQ